METNKEIIIYKTDDGKANVSLMAKDGNIWINQNQIAELFDTSKQTISYHTINILEERELDKNSVIKDYLTTASGGKKYRNVISQMEDLKTLEETIKKRDDK